MRYSPEKDKKGGGGWNKYLNLEIHEKNGGSSIMAKSEDSRIARVMLIVIAAIQQESLTNTDELQVKDF